MGERRPSTDIAEWHLDITNLSGDVRRLTWDDYSSLDHREITFDIHCVTSWTRFDSTFTGVPLSEIAKPSELAAFVSFGSFSERDHHTSLPIEYAMEHTWVVHEFEGQALSSEHGGPVRTVTPGRYFYKSIKWLRSVTFLAEDRLGWWEVNSQYHNNADPETGDQRFTSGSLRPNQVRRFAEAETFDKYRGRVLLGLDLRGWEPGSSDLRRIYLKNCDLRGAKLGNADLRNANLSLSDLREADLRGANLSGADLEGTNFEGGDLSGADLSGTALSATRFTDASVEGARFHGVWGLVESQRRYLVERGISL